MSAFEDVDFFADRTFVTDPYPYYEYLRGQGSVHQETHHGVVMVTGYEEAISVLHDTATFSSCNSVTGPFPGFPVPLVGDDVGPLIQQYRDQLPMSDQLPTMDPPAHTAHRALLMRLITPKRLSENEDFMWRLADRQLDQFVARGSCEFISEFASPYALLVIADLLGVPEEDHPRFLARLLARRPGRVLGSTEEKIIRHPLEFLYETFTTYVAERRREPRDDVLTGLATATFPDGSLPEVIDVVRVAANLFAAGQETTVRLLSSAFQLMAERPDLQDVLRRQRHQIPHFVEEVLRYESPVKGDFRLARVPTSVGGAEVPAGTTVMVLNGAANRDPRRFPRGDEFLLDRSNARQHLAFGHGIHTCPGAPLARAEARISIERALDRMADIKVSEPNHGIAGARRYEYLPTYILRGLVELHMEFSPIE
jgi:cytochrome P450